MKRPRRTYRVHDDTQAAIEAMADQYEMGLGEVLELVVEHEARQMWGRNWRERVRERVRGLEATPEAGCGAAEPPAGRFDFVREIEQMAARAGY